MIPVRDGLAHPDLFTPELIAFFDGHVPPDPVAAAGEPFVGVTTDGAPIGGLNTLSDDGFDNRAAVAAATTFLSTLTAAERAQAQRPMSSPHWRMWSNAFPFPDQDLHGIWLSQATPTQRAAALAVVEASLSPHGYRLTRSVMRLNAWLGEYIQQYLDTLTEWTYLFAVFGEPHPTEPWGWQLWGHHLDVTCVVIGSQMVLTPTFMGAEPNFAPDGTTALDEERTAGFDMYDALDPTQRATATLHRSMRSGDLPRELAGPINGRHLSGAGEDNRIIPYAGIRGDALTRGQREALLRVPVPYLERMPTGPRDAKLAAIERHLDDTWFAWIGGDDPDGAHYYRVHSPVVLIEYDNHPGIFLDNDEPEPFHVHTIVRTPNGGDYGIDLLAQHYAAHDHGHAHH
jgi:hypothetical protein